MIYLILWLIKQYPTNLDNGDKFISMYFNPPPLNGVSWLALSCGHLAEGQGDQRPVWTILRAVDVTTKRNIPNPSAK